MEEELEAGEDPEDEEGLVGGGWQCSHDRGGQKGKENLVQASNDNVSRYV